MSVEIGKENILGKIIITETAGLEREIEYVEFPLQVAFGASGERALGITAIDKISGERIVCQVIREYNFPDKAIALLRVIFPVSIAPKTTRTFILNEEKFTQHPKTVLRLEGEGLELKIENEHYIADLTRRAEPEPKTHASGQIQALLIKLGLNQLLTNEEDRIHWAPNFKREELEYYTTIAHWENPREYKVDNGGYLIRTIRRDLAPDHPEIMLTAVYKFYAGVPYFKFYSEMEFIDTLPLELLRNDEMTMDSMFTHLAFERPDGEIVDIKLTERTQILKEQPIEDNANWICFYNIDHRFAYSTIRLRYDNHNRFGEHSPTHLPHTQIGEWMGRKYWNRRLIHDHLTVILKGSHYQEENAYLVFKIGKGNRFAEIQHWMARLRNPIISDLYPSGTFE